MRKIWSKYKKKSIIYLLPFCNLICQWINILECLAFDMQMIDATNSPNLHGTRPSLPPYHNPQWHHRTESSLNVARKTASTLWKFHWKFLNCNSIGKVFLQEFVHELRKMRNSIDQKCDINLPFLLSSLTLFRTLNWCNCFVMRM